ncbi:hypothetical protein AB0I53_46910 [Saccharopolyspora sp. NPDC050389]
MDLAGGARHVSFVPPMGPDSTEAVALLGKEVPPVLRSSFGSTREGGDV